MTKSAARRLSRSKASVEGPPGLEEDLCRDLESPAPPDSELEQLGRDMLERFIGPAGSGIEPGPLAADGAPRPPRWLTTTRLAIEEMQEMVEATLAFARGVAIAKASEPVDLAALLVDLQAEMSEAGMLVTLSAAPESMVWVRPVALRPAVRNLVDNAFRYGGGQR